MSSIDVNIINDKSMTFRPRCMLLLYRYRKFGNYMFNMKDNLANGRRYQYYYNSLNGWWRSLVAHLTGGQGVAGSNPVQPTRE